MDVLEPVRTALRAVPEHLRGQGVTDLADQVEACLSRQDLSTRSGVLLAWLRTISVTGPGPRLTHVVASLPWPTWSLEPEQNLRVFDQVDFLAMLVLLTTIKDNLDRSSPEKAATLDAMATLLAEYVDEVVNIDRREAYTIIWQDAPFILEEIRNEDRVDLTWTTDQFGRLAPTIPIVVPTVVSAPPAREVRPPRVRTLPRSKNPPMDFQAVLSGIIQLATILSGR